MTDETCQRTSNQEVDWTEVIEKMTDDLERTRNLLETKTAAWKGALQANANLHEKIAAHETTVKRLADECGDQHDEIKRLRAALEQIAKQAVDSDSLEGHTPEYCVLMVVGAIAREALRGAVPAEDKRDG